MESMIYQQGRILPTFTTSNIEGGSSRAEKKVVSADDDEDCQSGLGRSTL